MILLFLVPRNESTSIVLGRVYGGEDPSKGINVILFFSGDRGYETSLDNDMYITTLNQLDKGTGRVVLTLVLLPFPMKKKKKTKTKTKTFM